MNLFRAIIFFVVLLFPSMGWGLADVYYSDSPFGTGDIKTGSPNITINGSGVATLTVAQTGNIGQGDAVEYNSLICYISVINSSTSLDLVTATGGTCASQSETAVTSIHHEYASLSAAEAGFTDEYHVNDTDLTNADVVVNLTRYYDHDDQTADTTATVIDFGTTDATRYLTIYTPQGGTESINNQRHSGVWDDNKSRLVVTAAGGYTYALTITEEYVRADGLQIEVNGSTTFDAVGITHTGPSNGDVRISNNVIRGALSAGGYQSGLIIWRSSKIWNNIIYDFEDSGINTAYYNAATIYLYNNTVWGSAIGINNFNSDNTVTAKNNITQNCTDGYNGTFDASSDYNISDVSQADADSANATFDGYLTVSFVDSANDDFHLASDDTAAMGAGIGPSSDANVPTTDIDGDNRSGTTCDIGADEYVAAGGVTIPILLHNLMRN